MTAFVTVGFLQAGCKLEACWQHWIYNIYLACLTLFVVFLSAVLGRFPPEGGDWPPKWGCFSNLSRVCVPSLATVKLDSKWCPWQMSLTVADDGTQAKSAAAWILLFRYLCARSDHPLHQITWFLVEWSLCNKQIWLQKKWSGRVKGLVIQLNMCCFPIESFHAQSMAATNRNNNRKRSQLREGTVVWQPIKDE